MRPEHRGRVALFWHLEFCNPKCGPWAYRTWELGSAAGASAFCPDVKVISRCAKLCRAQPRRGQGLTIFEGTSKSPRKAESKAQFIFGASKFEIHA